MQICASQLCLHIICIRCGYCGSGYYTMLKRLQSTVPYYNANDCTTTPEDKNGADQIKFFFIQAAL